MSEAELVILYIWFKPGTRVMTTQRGEMQYLAWLFWRRDQLRAAGREAEVRERTGGVLGILPPKGNVAWSYKKTYSLWVDDKSVYPKWRDNKSYRLNKEVRYGQG